jgi:hypothetical protein
LPATILEKLEHCETILDTIVNNQVLEKFRIGALDQKGSEEPAVAKDTLFDVTWAHLVTRHERLALRSDLLGSLPLNLGHVDGVLWWILWIIVQRCIIGWEFRISKKSIIIRADLDNLLNLVLNGILLWLLLLHLIMLLIAHHLLAILVHLISVVLILLKQLIDLILGQWHTVGAKILLVRVILPHLRSLN